MPAAPSAGWVIPSPWGVRSEFAGEFASANLVREERRPPSNRMGDAWSSCDGKNPGWLRIRRNSCLHGIDPTKRSHDSCDPLDGFPLGATSLLANLRFFFALAQSTAGARFSSLNLVSVGEYR